MFIIIIIIISHAKVSTWMETIFGMETILEDEAEPDRSGSKSIRISSFYHIITNVRLACTHSTRLYQISQNMK